MLESLSLSPTPVGEECAQLGAPDYHSRARKECRAFINQLIREFGEPPASAGFRISQNPHDFGTYLDVEIRFRDEDEEAVEYAYNLESNLPEHWDEEALKEIAAE